MNFNIKIVLSVVLMVQFSFAESVLFYQKPSVKNAVEFMSAQPTVDEMAKVIAFNKMDAHVLVATRKLLKEKNIAGTTRMPVMELKGNKLTIEGLRYPIVFSNSDKLKISYNGENVVLKNVNNIEQTFKDIEVFFAHKVGKSDAVKYLLFRLGVGEPAEAVLFIPYLIFLAIVAVAGGVYSWWNNKNRKGLEEWPFDVDNFGKELRMKCEAGNLSIICGNEILTFRNDSAGAPTVDYLDSKNPALVGTLTMSTEAGLAKPTGRFANAFYSQPKKDTLMSMAKVVLGEGGQRKICNENEFAENLGPVYAEIAAQVTSLSKKKAKPQAIQTLRKLDSANQSK